jgi:hypothetical protein
VGEPTDVDFYAIDALSGTVTITARTSETARAPAIRVFERTGAGAIVPMSLAGTTTNGGGISGVAELTGTLIPGRNYLIAVSASDYGGYDPRMAGRGSLTPGGFADTFSYRLTVNFGTATSTGKVDADYDGDGRSDLAVWRPSTGAWHARTVSGSMLINGTSWGLPGDVPVSGDYDGDGKSDLAVWRPSNGSWYIRTVSGSDLSNGVSWGLPGDLPISGDYDGDGKSDLAVWRKGSGRWYIRTLAGSPVAYDVWWGLTGDVPVSASTTTLAALDLL